MGTPTPSRRDWRGTRRGPSPRRCRALWFSAPIRSRAARDAEFGKPASVADAGAQLRFLSGRTHRLHSAAAIARDGALLFETVAHADLTMRLVSDEFLAGYLDHVAEAATTSAGAYQIEGLGVHLFERIVGDHWTIIGLPLLPVLAALRREGALLS